MRLLYWLRSLFLRVFRVNPDIPHLERHIRQLRGKVSKYERQIDDRDMAIKRLRDEIDVYAQRVIELQQKLYIERSNMKVAQEVGRIIGHKSGLEVFKGGKE